MTSYKEVLKERNANNGIELAIVIPYYKISFFNTLLSALSKQSNKQFRVYIGDDCSPSDPTPIMENYSKLLPITYHRFKERLGHTHLTQQWDRCVKLVNNEKWVWVLPDDDYPSPNVVASFYTALQYINANNINAVRLPMQTIDENGDILRKASDDPVLETNYQFYSRLIRGKTAASLGDNIFRRSALLSSGGFVDFPKAWGSDHATLLRVSAGSKIYCLCETYLGFRLSDDNISSDRSDGREKMAARVKFAYWLKSNEQIFPTSPDEEFYRHFYWKGEFFVLHRFNFSLGVWHELYKLRKICLSSVSPHFFLKLILLKARLLIKKALTPN